MSLLTSCASSGLFDSNNSQQVPVVNTKLSTNDQFTSVDVNDDGLISPNEFNQIDKTNYIAPTVIFSILMITIALITYSAAKASKKDLPS